MPLVEQIAVNPPKLSVLRVTSRRQAGLLQCQNHLFDIRFLKPEPPIEVYGILDDKIWKLFCNNIIDSALAQPQCFVHRDFHSCNLLKTDANGIGIIDFQDGVIGPVSYDFISLIWDRYLSWPRSDIENWMEEIRLNLELQITPDNWRRYCDLMGLQRNLKIVGIFARLYYRDGKSGYIEMIPRFYDYITSTLRLYPEFKEVLTFMEQAECAP